MMGKHEAPAQLFCEFDSEWHVPTSHVLREIDLFLDADRLREALRFFYSHIAIRSEPRARDEVYLNLAYRGFCRLGLERKPRTTRSSRYRQGQFRESNLLRQLISAWRDDHDHHRPHTNLDGLAPRKYHERSVEGQTLNRGH